MRTGFIKLITLMTCALVISGCDHPLSILRQKAREYGFHPFTLPIEDGLPGTLVAGNENQLSLVASSDTCFPDQVNQGLVKNYKSINFDQEVKDFSLDLSNSVDMKMYESIEGAPKVKFKLDTRIKTHTEIRISDIRVRSFELPKVFKVIDSWSDGDSLEGYCKSMILDKNLAIIGETVEANKIEVVVKNEFGQIITLDADKVEGMFDFKNRAEWKFEGNYKIVMEGPRGIGYKLYIFGRNPVTRNAEVQLKTTGRNDPYGRFIMDKFQTNYVVASDPNQRPEWAHGLSRIAIMSSTAPNESKVFNEVSASERTYSVGVIKPENRALEYVKK